MRQLYEIIIKIKWNTLCSKLSWSHYREVLLLKDINEIKYYLDSCERNNLTVRELQSKIKSNEYNRLSDETKKKLIERKITNVSDLVPNPIYIKTKEINNNLSEYALKEIILNNLDEFLLNLGNGFSYIGNEYKIKIGDRYNYIDLLLYNINYNCYVVIELKVTELKKEHIGQIQTYMAYIDKNLKRIDQDKTIGLIIVKKDNKYLIEYSSDNRIRSIEYEVKL